MNIPNGWKIKHLVDVVTKERYSFTGGPFGSNLKSNEYTQDGVRIIQLQNIGDGRFLDDYKIYTSEQKADELISCNIYPGDIIIAKMGNPVARATFVPNTEKRFLMASDGIRLAVDKEKYNPRFILEIINSFEFRKNAKKYSTGTTRQRISLSDLKKLPIPIPPLAEQKRIAEVLETWDEAITLTEQNIKAKELRKKGLMQLLLTGEMRLPGFEEEWQEITIGQLGKIYSGGTPNTSESDYWGGEINWCTPSEITKLTGIYIEKTERTISKAGLKNSSAKLLKKGSVIICTRATIGNCAINTVPMTTNQGFKSLTPSKKYHSEFIYYLFSFNKPVFIRYAAGSTFLEISKKDFSKIKLDVPPLPEQQAIAEILQTADEEIRLYKQKLAALRQQKKGLMQLLLTGKKRLQTD